MQKFVEVLLPLPFDNCFTYESNMDLGVGDVVQVEFGRRRVSGVVYKVLSGDEAIAVKGNSKYKIKSIDSKNELLSINKANLDFIDDVSRYNMATKGLVLKSFIGFLNSDKVSEKTISGSAIDQEIDSDIFATKSLSQSQSEVAKDIYHKMTIKEPPLVSLIDGVTGSGKTEIYFEIIAKMLRDNKDNSQILIILPEISLSAQLLTRFEDVFKFKPVLWHSKISKKDKRGAFYGIANGSVKVVIGARSALLLPFKNLKIIVVDEEHDPSLKQEEVFNFNARDMAILRGSNEKFPVILCSATPSVESYSNAKAGKYNYYILKNKFHQKNNEVQIVDLRIDRLKKNSYISDKLKKEIITTLGKKKQVLLFVNRRGYSPVVMCSSCGEKVTCGNCSANMVYHKTKKQLICHYCDNKMEFSSDCSKCGSKGTIIDVGVGVEKLHEEVKGLFPDSKTTIVTSDSVGSFDDMKNVVDQISNNEIDIIIGTQMISKGYDFKDLELIGIVDVDSILYSSDFRSLERSFQLLSQLSGRAGRRDSPGKVLIQTYNDQNYILKIIKDLDKDGFYNFELKNRKMMEFPPFSKMVKMEISSFSEDECKKFCSEIKNFLPINDKIEVSGPAPAPVLRLKNRYFYNLFIKVNKKINLHKLILDIKNSIGSKKNIKFRIDIDPN